MEVNFMEKIKLTTVLDSENDGISSFEGVGMLKNNELIFFENSIKVVISMIDNMIKIRRITDEYTLELQFTDSLTKEGIYDIKGGSIQIPVKTNTSSLKISDGNIHIEYVLELSGVNQGKFIYDVNYEVIK